MGFLGGVNLALVAAHAVGSCSSATRPRSAAALLCRAFRTVAEWSWPSPLRLNGPTSSDNAALAVKPWDAAADRAAVMPILTPVHPCANSTHGISWGSRRILLREFASAAALSQRALAHGSNDGDDGNGRSAWDSLMAPSDFFTRYASYVALDASAPSRDALDAWSGLVAARLRLLVAALQHMDEACPWPDAVSAGQRVSFFVGVQGTKLALASELAGAVGRFAAALARERKPGWNLRAVAFARDELAAAYPEITLSRERDVVSSSKKDDGLSAEKRSRVGDVAL